MEKTREPRSRAPVWPLIADDFWNLADDFQNLADDFQNFTDDFKEFRRQAPRSPQVFFLHCTAVITKITCIYCQYQSWLFISYLSLPNRYIWVNSKYTIQLWRAGQD